MSMRYSPIGVGAMVKKVVCEKLVEVRKVSCGVLLAVSVF